MTTGKLYRTENGCVLFSRAFVAIHRLTHNDATARFAIILTNEKCEETESVGYVDSRFTDACHRATADITLSYYASRNREKASKLCHMLTCANPGQNTPLAPPGPKSQSKIPSRLRESSTASFLEPDAIGASPESRSSSPGTVATPTSSSLGNGRPNGTSGGVSVEEKRVAPRIPSPPRPLPPVTRRPETDYLVGKHTIIIIIIILCLSVTKGDLATDLDVEGDETGSSTDTDTE